MKGDVKYKMTEAELQQIGYIKKSYGSNGDDNRFQCFHCKHGSLTEDSREKVICSKWNIITNEDDKCNAFEFHQFWAFNQMEEDRARRSKKMEEYKASKSSEGCYIATAVYGGYDKPEVCILRKFRDEVLKKIFLGRLFIKIYYAISPKMAMRLKEHKYINNKVRCILDRIVEQLKTKY